jgi:hypothetical protein
MRRTRLRNRSVNLRRIFRASKSGRARGKKGREQRERKIRKPRGLIFSHLEHSRSTLPAHSTDYGEGIGPPEHAGRRACSSGPRGAPHQGAACAPVARSKPRLRARSLPPGTLVRGIRALSVLPPPSPPGTRGTIRQRLRMRPLTWYTEIEPAQEITIMAKVTGPLHSS